MRLETTRLIGLSLLGAALFAGCGGGSSDTSGGGGGGGGGGLQIFHYMAIPSTDVRDGYVSEAGLVSTGGFTGFVGDNPAHQENRAVLSFNLDTLPPGAQVEHVYLWLKSDFDVGDWIPFTGIQVNHCDFGPFIDAIDFGTAPRTPGAVPSDGSLSWTNIPYDVTSRVLADIADGRTWSDYRVRFEIATDFDAEWDGMQVLTAGGPGAVTDRTHLMVTYTMP